MSIGGIANDGSDEMMINKFCRTSVVHPTQDYIQRIASYIPYHNKCLVNIHHQAKMPSSEVCIGSNSTHLGSFSDGEVFLVDL